MYVFVELPPFSRYREDYFDDEAFRELQSHLLAQPTSGDVIPGTGGVRKLRWSRSGMGKRGGVRVVYYVQDAKGRNWLLTVYAKSAKENVANALLNELRKVADHAEID